MAAEAELIELEAEVAKGGKPIIRGGEKGTDQPKYEVKARTEPFTSDKNAQNFFNDRIKAGNTQFAGGMTTGEIIINLGENTTIGGTPISSDAARLFVQNALSKGNRGTNVTKVIIKDASGNIIYSGLGE